MNKLAKAYKKASVKMSLAALTLLWSGVGSASTTDLTGDNFYTFMQTIQNMASGAFGIAISLIALLVGGVVGLMKMSALPPLLGVALAVIFRYGPQIIQNIISEGAVI